MKIRHVRAIAVFGIALVALTGARGSGGGGCDNSSSSSSSSSGGSHRDDDTSGGSGGSVPGGGSSADKAIRDVTIDECAYDAATRNLVARISVDNDAPTDYEYLVTLEFSGDSGSTVVPVTATESGISVTANGTASTEVSAPYSGSGDGSEYTRCEVGRVTRS
ncbi:hypothetical protein [Streptomyces sp. NPDC005805]|uniref:hypothetical protein n=1 Tax=Streptomyces sp. NPDC005805 TaxID=3157068 RepID=UPI0033D53068